MGPKHHFFFSVDWSTKTHLFSKKLIFSQLYLPQPHIFLYEICRSHYNTTTNTTTLLNIIKPHHYYSPTSFCAILQNKTQQSDPTSFSLPPLATPTTTTANIAVGTHTITSLTTTSVYLPDTSFCDFVDLPTSSPSSSYHPSQQPSPLTHHVPKLFIYV